ncbi:dTDP-4-dehydrorhamnose reductase [Tamlana crocina]|uniref:dTDP-4-dehydrorhamnose reductase n=1 Tax=Tamlana crocina TaxID=393006 RepID=A0ABX1D7U7_9FLAO|nr:dTDP-4-dehydrorhamnose reductase [Tamlana crocina]NJX14037.1 dTDP-4-dehydrorhamnose reductase [Tamlana crocina]
MDTKVLVTGANGQLGKTIEELFAKNNLGVDFTFVSKTEFDIRDLEKVSSFFEKNEFDFCINCAAYTNVEQAEKTPEIAYKVNAEGAKNLALACKNNDVVLIHISTDYVFDGEKTTPYTVKDKTNPINEYGKSKLLGEEHIQSILSKYFIVRTSWLYSKKYGRNFYKTILALAEEKDELSITTDQLGCPTDTESLARFVVGLIAEKSKAFSIQHFSDDEVMTWYDFARKILSENDLINKVNLVKTSNYVTFAQRPRYSVIKTGG